jgi:hypothetical protein
MGVSLCHLGQVASAQNDAAASRAFFVESLSLRREGGEKRGMAECLEGLGGLDAALGRHELAARRLAAATALREAISAPLSPIALREQQEIVARLRDALGDLHFTRAWDEGLRAPLEQVVAEALDDTAAGGV